MIRTAKKFYTQEEYYDRGEKFMLYRSIPTLQVYILIDSLSVKVEDFKKQNNENWLLQEYNSLYHSFLIESINYQFPLLELYEGVELL